MIDANQTKTVHNLDFCVRPWRRNPDWTEFQVCSVTGLYRATPERYEILSIINETPGNGHFEDVLQWFEHSCRRDGKKLAFLEFTNKRFKHHLITKRGFYSVNEVDAEKIFQ